MCGTHKEFRLHGHIMEEHKATLKQYAKDNRGLFEKKKYLYELVEQLSRGVTQQMGAAKINLTQVTAPVTDGEKTIYNEFKRQIRNCGIPKGAWAPRDTHIVNRCEYVRRDEVEAMIQEAEVLLYRVLTRSLIDEFFHQVARALQMQHAPQGVEEEQMVVDEDEATCLQAPSSSARVEDEDWESEARPSAQDDDLQMSDDEREHVRTAWEVERREVPAVRPNVSDDEEESDEGGVMWAPDEPAITARAPPIARHMLYEIFGDKQYEGGSKVHGWFLRPPNITCMFWHEQDVYDTDYYEISYKIPLKQREEGWMKDALEKLALWRKLKRAQHPVLGQYERHIIGDLPNISKNQQHSSAVVSKPFKNGKIIYIACVERFMLVAMRARQRCGQRVTLDDAIFSVKLVRKFSERLEEVGVSVHVQSNFAKSLASFYKFLHHRLDAEAGKRRVDELVEGQVLTRDFVSKLSAQGKRDTSLKAIMPSEKEVGAYILPKSRCVLQKKAVFQAQYFVLDATSKKWLNYYVKLRNYVVEKNALKLMSKPLAPFFLKWKGKRLDQVNVHNMLKQVLRDIDYGDLNMSCNTVARTAYKSQMQLSNYNDRYVTACISGYIKIRTLLDRDKKKHVGLVSQRRRNCSSEECEAVEYEDLLREYADMIEEEEEMRFDDMDGESYGHVIDGPHLSKYCRACNEEPLIVIVDPSQDVGAE
ncbi:hypothetical protein Y032_0497g2502 [Ancylostoma ceylanicum]|uniref:Uncharacterized protein n=2 Tax=Ancylostoma ceylanicum TaxID=53326 RepID=A0A016WUH9_9BILA|nr:hypothetical protein Y032_0497g2502 [Ancylostoma ceylanicum]